MLKKAKQFIEEHKFKILGGISFALGAYAFYKYSQDETRIRLSAFLEALQSRQLDEVVVVGNTAYFKSAVSEWYHTSLGRYPLQMLFNQLQNTPDLKFACENENPLIQALIALGMASVTTAITARLLMPEQFRTINKFPKIVKNHQTFNHFYGSEQVKLKLKEIVEYLKNKEKFQRLGGRVRKGILLYGPPGTGKTMLAKTLANQAGLPFIQTCASQFEEIYVGMGPKKIRDIFQRAKACPQGCIIFIDQLDAIGSRSSGMRFSRQTTATINQLLTELDGFEESSNIVVIGATNRIDLVDFALIRAGRFDIKVMLHLPNKNQRLGIFNTLLTKKNVPNQLTQNLKVQVAQKSEGWSGADLQTLINESIYKAIRQQLPTVRDQNIIEAMKQIQQK